ncbi:DUF475 domain-containing protein [Acinetobacter nectaris]|uniref:Integral membrane protein n=1 Tax=Acinetobacter nectaris CIP 110549 TaxID=1392540 RepID=V2TLL3_9GAMM|nr:DUF475 domain-containing protein [Acinetobacter nectaris]ESK38691.1 hypothetical protein P256_01508 [Acinetobacter nectaris CIP 110549]MCF9034286.1 DUF475 domain-containing protein [Acinetobacter nectaris]
MLKHFRFSLLFTLICLVVSAYWGYTHGANAGFAGMFKVLAITLLLAVMEISLSFDNAVVNASVLKHWNPFWRKLFLTVGVLVAVFGMRLLFPLLIVGFTADMAMVDVAKLALNNPIEYSKQLTLHHAEIVAFGGMFLLLVFLNFIFDQNKDTHWFKWIESHLSNLGRAPAISIFIAIACLMVLSEHVTGAAHHTVTMAGLWGVMVYVGVQVVSSLLEENSDSNANADLGKTIVKGGMGGFLYLEILDASFSFDGVLGAFAVTTDVVTIMIGLAIGAMFVRSLTVYLVEKGTLDAYIYLEHGAHYAIGALAFIMLSASTGLHISEVVTGLIGIFFIGWSTLSSISHNKQHATQNK